MAIPCAVMLPHGYKEFVAVPCGREKRPDSPVYCYWHRLARCRMADQVIEAQRRASLTPAASRKARVPLKDWPAGERWCAGCQIFVPLWYCIPRKGKIIGSQCRACAHASDRTSRDLSIYGVGREAKERVAALQEGRCAGCGNRPRSKAHAIDHDHKTGRARGLLDENCNHKVIGGAFESYRILLFNVYYLLYPPFEGEWKPPWSMEMSELLALISARA